MEFEEDETTPAYMELSKVLFALRSPEHRGDLELTNKLTAGIVEGNMAPYYIEVCAQLGWVVDKTLLNKMEEENKVQLARFGEPVEEGGSLVEKGSTSTADVDVSNVWYEKLLYLGSIGDKDAAVALADEKARDRTLSVNRRLDAIFARFRVAFFHGCDVRAMRDAVAAATQLMEAGTSGGGDWSARNKLKAYEAVFCLAVRDYPKAAPLFLDAIPTFESGELLSFQDFFRYSVVAAMIALSRGDLKDRLLRPGVMPQNLHSQAPELREFFTSLYHCQYGAFFLSLADLERDMKLDPVLAPHYRHYVREMRLRAYVQLLCAYRSLSLASMAETFGVTEDMIEREVSRFTASGRLRCKIDHVGRRVLTEDAGYPLDHHRLGLYQGVIKKGDSILNRLKNLTRVLDV